MIIYDQKTKLFSMPVKTMTLSELFAKLISKYYDVPIDAYKLDLFYLTDNEVYFNFPPANTDLCITIMKVFIKLRKINPKLRLIASEYEFNNIIYHHKIKLDL